MPGGVRIAVVGLGFGSAFVPIYKAHADVEEVAICELDRPLLDQVGDEHGISARYDRLDQILQDPKWDAVHLLTPVPLHAEQVLQVLDSGKHCASAVPMATSLADIDRILTARKRSGRNYMLMETAAYSREFLYVQEMLREGRLGALTFLRGAYYQDLEGAYPRYWWAMPPMHYATHSLSPLIALADGEVRKVSCFGSGRLKDSIQQPGGNTFPLQTAIFKMANSDVAIELTRSWFQIARGYTEAFSVYGDLRSFEWQQLEHEDPVLFELPPVDPKVRWRDATAQRVQPPYRPDLLPTELKRFADGGHGGSHPHLANEFIRSIVEDRKPAIDSLRAAQWTAPGICADLSSLQDGDPIQVPSYG